MGEDLGCADDRERARRFDGRFAALPGDACRGLRHDAREERACGNVHQRGIGFLRSDGPERFQVFRRPLITLVGPPVVATVLAGNPHLAELLVYHPRDGEDGQRPGVAWR